MRLNPFGRRLWCLHGADFIHPVFLAGPLFALWYVVAVGQILKYFSVVGSIVVSLSALLFIAMGLFVIERRVQSGRDISGYWLIALFVLFMAAELYFYPIANHRRLAGMGSDREDALFRGIQALLCRRFPYLSLTFLGGPISPMPGSFLLALPFYWLGRVSFQNYFWSAAFLIFCRQFFRTRCLALFYFLAFVILLPGNMQDIVSGGDYVINVFYICISQFLLWKSARANSLVKLLFASVFFGVSVASRPIYLVSFPIVCAMLLRTTRPMRAAIAVLSAVGATLLCILPFYLHDPGHFTPLAAGSISVDSASAKLHLRTLLPMAAFLVAFAAFFVRPTIVCAYGILGISIATMILPVFILDRLFIPSAFPLTNVIYFAPVSLLLSMGLLAKWETRIAGRNPLQVGL